MMKKRKMLIRIAAFSVLGLSLIKLVSADDLDKNSDSLQEIGSQMAERLSELSPQMQVERVISLKELGVYAIEISGGRTIYGMEDGIHFFTGNLFRFDGGITNLSELRQNTKREQLMNAISDEDTIAFGEGEGRFMETINVFTDVDCGYCRKLHSEIGEINALGIRVRYLAYPRGGIGSEGYQKLVTAWCSKDSQETLTNLKAGRTVEMSNCESPVKDQYFLGQQIGISGTPAIITSDGRLFPGYLPAGELSKRIFGMAKNN
jgi:thiol:disulfide interchange protein DsbC